MTKLSHGFSLVEMAVVLIIIGLLMGGLLTPLSTQMNWQKIKVTQQRLEKIKEALLGFAIIHNRLPCVDTDGNGQENKNASETACQINGEGYLPWKDLGTGRYDAWGKPFRYRTEAKFNKITGIELGKTTSGLRIKDRENNYLTTTSGDSRVVAIIFSSGKNELPSNEEKENSDGDKTYIYNGYLENEFDDILTWLSANSMMNRLITAGKWPP